MNQTLKSSFAYILSFSLLMVVFALAYFSSVVLFFFLIGALILPLVVLATPFAIFYLWKGTAKKMDNKFVKYAFLLISYGIFVYLLIQLDSASWNENGNLDLYLKWLGIR